MAYQPGLFGYSFLFGCTLLVMSNMERFLKYAVDPMVERRVRATHRTTAAARTAVNPLPPTTTQTQAAKERHDGMMKAKELAAKASH